jgi:hypothetical protein
VSHVDRIFWHVARFCMPLCLRPGPPSWRYREFGNLWTSVGRGSWPRVALPRLPGEHATNSLRLAILTTMPARGQAPITKDWAGHFPARVRHGSRALEKSPAHIARPNRTAHPRSPTRSPCCRAPNRAVHASCPRLPVPQYSTLLAHPARVVQAPCTRLARMGATGAERPVSFRARPRPDAPGRSKGGKMAPVGRALDGR